MRLSHSLLVLLPLAAACDVDLFCGEDDPVYLHPDKDGDGWGEGVVLEMVCPGDEAGHVDQGGDCDDDDASVHPDAIEVCNGEDDDCDGGTDNDAVDMITSFGDADRDGWGDAAYTVTECSIPDGFVTQDGDCDDDDTSVHPDAEEVANGVDDDCDGGVE